jgi:hypothetical protein
LDSQAQTFRRIREQLGGLFDVSKIQLLDLLKINGCRVGTKIAYDRSKCLEILIDLIIFGTLPACDACGEYYLRWNDNANLYRCAAYSSNDRNCGNTETRPHRTPFKLTSALKNHEILSSFKGKIILRKPRVFSALNEAHNLVSLYSRALLPIY